MREDIHLDAVKLLRFARAIERDCQEGVKWEIRKLAWILEEEREEQAKAKQASEEA